MSNPGELTGAEKIKELLDVLTRIEEIVKSYTSNDNPTKLKITLNTHLNQLTDKVNDFFSDLTHTTKEKLDTTIRLLQHLNEIMVYIPRKNDLYLTWLNYASMVNFVRSNMAFIHHESDLGKSMSTAGALSQLLLGEIQHIEEIPELPSQTDPVKFFDYFIPLFNAVQSTFGVYHMLIDSLALISLSDFITWTNHAIWHYKMLIQLCNTVDIRLLLETRKIKNIQNFYNNILNLGTTVASSSYIFATVFEKLTHFPKEIDDLDLLPSKTMEGLIIHTKEILERFRSIEKAITDAYNEFLINRNDKIEEADLYPTFKIVQDDMEMMIELLKFDNNKMSGDINQIEIIIKKYQYLLHETIDEAGGLEKLKSSYTLTSYVHILKEIIPFIALKSVIKDDYTIIENYLLENRDVMQAIEINQFAEYHFIKILSLLHVYSRIATNKLELVEYFTELNIIKESFSLRPRLYVGVNLLLIQLVKMGINIADVQLFEYNIQETIQQNFAFSTFAQETEHYLLYLNDRENIDISGLMYRREHVPFDIYSWIYPDWSKISDIEYIPFSRLKDTVLK